MKKNKKYICYRFKNCKTTVALGSYIFLVYEHVRSQGRGFSTRKVISQGVVKQIVISIFFMSKNVY